MDLEERYSQIDASYRDRVYTILHRLKDDEPYVIAEKVNPDNHTRFKVVVAYFIKWNEGGHFGFRVEFNNDFTKIRRVSSNLAG